MKRFSFIILSSLFVSISSAQTSFKYTSPEKSGLEPVAVEASTAKSESASAAPTCGYSQVYYSKRDLDYLMDLSDCVGIRFYNGKIDEKTSNCEMIAVAVNPDGKEIGHLASNKYLHANSYDVDTQCESKKVSKSNARGCVEHVADDKSLTYQKVFFSKDFLKKRLEVSNNGIVIIPVDSRDGSTMMVAGAKLENGKITELEGTYYRSQLPCPTDCGNTDNYLVYPK